MPRGCGHYLRHAFFACLLAAPSSALAQQAGKVYRIAYLTGSSEAARSAFLGEFKQGMRERGYVEGRSFVFEARYADGKFEKLPELAAELIRRRPDVLFVSTTPASLAAKRATATVPIVFVAVADPLGVGLIPNLARPGGNITGITNIVAELTGKRLALLKQIVPEASRIAILVNPDDPNASIQLGNAREAARALGVELHPIIHVRGAADLQPAFDAAARAGARAALRLVDPTSTMLRAQTVALASTQRLPVMYPFREDVEAGGLASYGTSLPGQYRQAAAFVDRILRGANPGDLPVEQPTKFDFALNMQTAATLGIAVPPALLLQAEQIRR